MTWTQWLIIQVVFTCSTNNVLVLWFFEKKHPSKSDLGTGCLISNKYSMPNELRCTWTHFFTEEGQGDGKRTVSPLILKVPAISGRPASIPKARKQIVVNKPAATAPKTGKTSLSSGRITAQMLCPSLLSLLLSSLLTSLSLKLLCASF